MIEDHDFEVQINGCNYMVEDSDEGFYFQNYSSLSQDNGCMCEEVGNNEHNCIKHLLELRSEEKVEGKKMRKKTKK